MSKPSACKHGHPLTWLTSEVAWCEQCRSPWHHANPKVREARPMHFGWLPELIDTLRGEQAELIETLRKDHAIAELAEQFFAGLTPDDPDFGSHRPELQEIIRLLVKERRAA